MQTIDIRTTQNVTIEYQLASLRERFLAFLLDLLIVGTSYIVLFLSLIGTLGNWFDNSPWLFSFFISFVPLGGFLFYHLLSEVLAEGQTWGKRAVGIKVVRLDGREPMLSDYLLRAIFHIVDTIFSGGVIGALMISSSLKNQRLGDMTANTTVIKMKNNTQFRLEDILKINSLEDYEPQYPEVKQLSEQDMLLIKNTISRYRLFRNEIHRKVITELVEHLRKVLDLPPIGEGKEIDFLKTLIRDYIVLTR